MDRLHWVDGAALQGFILNAQDDETGGIADRPGDVVDPFHTLFGVAGLSLLGWPDLAEVNPIYCLPQRTVQRVFAGQQRRKEEEKE